MKAIYLNQVDEDLYSHLKENNYGALQRITGASVPHIAEETHLSQQEAIDLQVEAADFLYDLTEFMDGREIEDLATMGTDGVEELIAFLDSRGWSDASDRFRALLARSE